MSNLGLNEWVSIIQSTILLVTIIIMIVQYRQATAHHNEQMESVLEAFRSQIHGQILGYLHDLNRIMLEFPNDIKRAFEDFDKSSAKEVRLYCYVYAILDILNYIVLHQDTVDKYMEEHLLNLARLLYTEVRMKKIFDEVKEYQSEALLKYLRHKVEPTLEES